MAKVIIFGIRDYAELAHYYLTSDSVHTVVAFCVNNEFLPAEPFFKGLPIVKFEDIEMYYPPSTYSFFAPMAPNKMNTIRQLVYENILKKGYEMISYISSKATVLNDGAVGENCFILENNTIQPFTIIGNNVVMWSGNHIGHHGVIKNHVTFTSHVVMSGHCVIEDNCFLGVNATLRDGINLAKGTLVGMAAALMVSSESWSVYIGNPAKRIEGKISNSLL